MATALAKKHCVIIIMASFGSCSLVAFPYNFVARVYADS